MYFISQLILVLLFYVIYLVITSEFIHIILKFSITFYIILWNITPGLIAVFSMELVKSFDLFSTVDEGFFLIFIIDSLTIASSTLFFVFFAKIKKTNLSNNYIQDNEKLSSILLIFAIIVITFSGFLDKGLTYTERNDSSTYGEKRDIISLTIGFVSSSLIQYSIYALIYSKIVSSKIKYLSLIALFINVYFHIIGGARIVILTILIPLIIRFYRLNALEKASSSKIWKTIFLFIGGVLILQYLVFPLLIFIGTNRANGAINEINVANTEINNESSIGVLFSKLNSFTSGSLLILNYGEGSAGIKPYIGSALFFLPRSIFPERPVAGSINGTISGTPAYLVPRVFYENTIQNVGVSPVAVSIWHFGMQGGLLIFFIFSFLNLVLINNFLFDSNIFMKIVALNFINMPSMLGVFTSPDFILKNFVVLFFIMFVKQIISINKVRLN